MGSKTKREERFINPDLRRTFRKTYNVNEVKWGVLVVLGLLGILSWVMWRGAHPDPTLLGEGTGLLVNSGSPAERGALPDELAPQGWSEASISRFGPDNLYEKINGREGFYKGFGFRELTFASLVAEDDPTLAIDIELYDLGQAINAVGCYAAERQPDAKTQISAEGLLHFARNGLFMTRGKYYARAIAPDESPKSLRALESLKQTLSAIPATALPWGFQAFANTQEIDSTTIEAYQRDAFSFSFATNVFSAKTGAGETSVFISPDEDPSAKAAQYQEAFAEMGDVEQGSIPWTKDRYLSEFSGASSEGSWVIGVRSATDKDTAEQALALIRKIAADASAQLLSLAQASANFSSETDDDAQAAPSDSDNDDETDDSEYDDEY